MRNISRYCLLLICSSALAAVGPPRAMAITISIDSITPLAGNTPTAVFGSSPRQSAFISDTSVLNSGESALDIVGATVSAATRYAMTQSSDADTATFPGSNSLTSTTSYQVVFSVTALPGLIYDLQIDTSRVGAFVRQRDGTSLLGWGQSSSDLGAVVGQLNAIPQGGLALGSAAQAPGDGNVSNAGFNQSNVLSIVGLTGSQSFTLQFDWQTTTRSNQNSGASGLETVVLMGLQGNNPIVGNTDAYPGYSGRTAANDGHFVSITATVQVVPEPGTFVMAGMAGLCLGMVAWRKRRLA